MLVQEAEYPIEVLQWFGMVAIDRQVLVVVREACCLEPSRGVQVALRVLRRVCFETQPQELLEAQAQLSARGSTSAA